MSTSSEVPPEPPPQRGAAPVRVAELRVQRAGVHDAEVVVLARGGGTVDEGLGLEADRDAGDDLVARARASPLRILAAASGAQVTIADAVRSARRIRARSAR